MLPGEQTYGQVDEDSRLWGPEIMARAERDMAAMTPGDWGEVEMGITAPPGFASIEAFEKARKPFEQIQPAHIQQMHEFVAADEELFAEIARESGEAWPREATDAQRKTWLERGMADSSKRKAIEERYERLYAQDYQYPRMMRRPSDLVEKIDGAPIRKLQEETRQRARYVNEAQAVEQGALSWENLPPEAQYRATEQVKYEIWKGIKQPGDDLNPAVLWNAYTRIRAAELQQVNPQGFATTDSPVAAYLWMVDEGISPEHASAATGYNPGKESEQPLRPRQ
jgi:hypothetical protein